MKPNKKTYFDECPVFEQFGEKWLSIRLPYEETTLGDKYALRYRKKGSNDEYLEHIAILYCDRFTDGNILDIPMINCDAEIGEWFEIDATKIDK